MEKIYKYKAKLDTMLREISGSYNIISSPEDLKNIAVRNVSNWLNSNQFFVISTNTKNIVIDIAPFISIDGMIKTGIERNASNLAVAIFLPRPTKISDETIKKYAFYHRQIKEMCDLFEMELLDTMIIDMHDDAYSYHGKGKI